MFCVFLFSVSTLTCTHKRINTALIFPLFSVLIPTCTNKNINTALSCADVRGDIEIIKMIIYDFAGSEYDGKPCVYEEDDCGESMDTSWDAYNKIYDACNGKTTCEQVKVPQHYYWHCGGPRYSDYVIVEYNCINIPTIRKSICN